MKLRLPAPGIAALFTLLLLAGGVTFSIWWPYHCEQTVIQSLEGSGGSVSAAYTFEGPAFLERYSDSEWLSWFRRIRSLQISNVQRGGIRDAPVPTPLRFCESVELVGCVIDDGITRQIAACSPLDSLKLIRCEVEAGALRGLDGHEHLTDIEMGTSEVDGGVLELPATPSLRSFRSNFNYSLRGLDVSTASGLRRVEVKNCAFDDDGVAALLDAPNLEVLMMPNTNITDAAIDDLVQLRSLRFLDVRLTRLSIQELGRLADLPRLRTVAVWYTVGPGQIDSLRETLPQATLDRRP